MKLYLCDQGDESVGIFPVTWEVGCPFEKPDLAKPFTDDDIADFEWFRQQQIDIFKEYANGKLTAAYDFEIQLENERIEKYCTE